MVQLSLSDLSHEVSLQKPNLRQRLRFKFTLVVPRSVYASGEGAREGKRAKARLFQGFGGLNLMPWALQASLGTCGSKLPPRGGKKEVKVPQSPSSLVRA